MEPSVLASKYGASFAGFACMNGKFKENSWTFNADDGFHDGEKNLSKLEKNLITGAIIEYAKAGFPAGHTIKVKDCLASGS